MATVFWDHKGVILVEFLEHGTTVNSEVYCQTLEKLRRETQNHWCGLLSSCFTTTHDHIAPPPHAKHFRNSNGIFLTTLLIVRTWHQVVTFTFFFMHLKNFLASQGFTNNEELKKGGGGMVEKTGGKRLWGWDKEASLTLWKVLI